MKDIKNVISERLKGLQEKRGISNVELSIATDINKASISQYRSGSREPDAEALVKIANYFNVSVDYLLGVNDIETANITEQEICEKMNLTQASFEVWQKWMLENKEMCELYETTNFDSFIKKFNALFTQSDFLDFALRIIRFKEECANFENYIKDAFNNLYSTKEWCEKNERTLEEVKECADLLFLNCYGENEVFVRLRSFAYDLNEWITNETFESIKTAREMYEAYNDSLCALLEEEKNSNN